jgi:hypothetical protein
MKTEKVFFIVLIAELLVAALAIYTDGFSLWGLQAVTRYSGRLSLAIFSAIFLFHNRPGNFDVALLGKPFHFFAFAHGMHLIELLAFVYFSGIALISYRLFGGVIAYLYIFLMPLAAYRNQQGKLDNKIYSVMEIIFQYYIWLVFFLTYLPRVRGTLPGVGGNYWEHVVLLGWVSLLLGMKITSILKIKPFTSR